MTSAHVSVNAGVGLHARPAAALVAAARAHACKLTVEYNGKVADAKGILQVLGLGVEDRETVTVRADGKGEDTALAVMIALFRRGLLAGARDKTPSPFRLAQAPSGQATHPLVKVGCRLDHRSSGQPISPAECLRYPGFGTQVSAAVAEVYSCLMFPARSWR
jgi:phosphotransferase system HPr (HPr) family protein